MEGAAVEPNTLFVSATFSLNGLDYWWPATGITGSVMKPLPDYRRPEPLTAIWEGTTVTMNMSLGVSAGARRRAYRESIWIVIDKEERFTFEWLEAAIITPLSGLLGACLNREAQYFDCTLTPLDRPDNFPRLVKVRSECP